MSLAEEGVQDLCSDVLELPPMPDDEVARPSSGSAASAQTGTPSTSSSASGRQAGQVKSTMDRPPPVVLAALLGGEAGASKEKLSGAIKSFNLDTGYGFISCARVQNLLACDVFFYKDELYDIDPVKVSKGSPCTFWCRMGKNSKPQARVVRITEPAFAKSAAVEDAELKWYVGKIKSFSKDKGYGFIECDETHRLYNYDVFLHFSKLRDFKIGDWVRFKIFVDVQKGSLQPKVSQLEAAEEPGEPPENVQEAVGGEAALEVAGEDEGREPVNEAAAADSSDSLQYRRFMSDDGRHWWWCEADEDWFFEDDPGDWAKYLDPATQRCYWWNPDERWFWEPSG